MPHLFNRIQILATQLYTSTENAVIGKALQSSDDNKVHCITRLIFDYTFFQLLFLVPKAAIALYTQNTTNLLLLPIFLLLLLTTMLMLKKGVANHTVALVASFTTLVLPMISSLFNNQETTPKYALAWATSILFCYLATSLRPALVQAGLLCTYLAVAAWMRLNHVIIFITPGYTLDQNKTFMSVIMAFYILLLIRVFGRHYHNILRFANERSLEKQKQHSSLLNQHLTKQFIILKGLSRSGQSKYLDGNKELLEACLIEIEKQCESAIEFLDNVHQPESRNGQKIDAL